VSLAVIAGVIYAKKYRAVMLMVFLSVGLVYNVFFVQEYLFGGFYGSPARLARAAVDYVIADKNTQSVITYNDIGAYDLRLNNKYTSRFYTAEARDYTEKLTTYRGQYLIVNFPQIDPVGRYWPLLNRCETLKKFSDKKVDALILDCSVLDKSNK